MVRPSLQPSSRSRWTKAATNRLQVAGVVAPRNPIVGSFPACCARAASGHAAAAPPSKAMNLRRLTSSMGSSPEPAVPAYRRLRMPRKHPQVLGADLNRSELSRLLILQDFLPLS